MHSTPQRNVKVGGAWVSQMVGAVAWRGVAWPCSQCGKKCIKTAVSLNISFPVEVLGRLSCTDRNLQIILA